MRWISSPVAKLTSLPSAIGTPAWRAARMLAAPCSRLYWASPVSTGGIPGSACAASAPSGFPGPAAGSTVSPSPAIQ
jgi:hypothetical protein